MFPTLVLLHGWGGSKESFAALRAALGNAPLRVLAPDLPGFGEEPAPSRPWTVDDYADWVERAVMAHGIDAPIHLLGHSHGGRIAIKMAVRGVVPVAHLYLCAPAGIRHAWHLKRWVGFVLAKIGRLLAAVPGLRRLRSTGRTLLYRLMRVHDYERASPLMQQTMLLVTKEDLRPALARIAVPTDFFWGKEDTMTPLADGTLMHGHVRGSRLHVFPGVRHAVHRDAAADVARVIREAAER